MKESAKICNHCGLPEGDLHHVSTHIFQAAVAASPAGPDLSLRGTLEAIKKMAVLARAKRTAWLEQYGVPISQEFAEFAEAIGELIERCEPGDASPSQIDPFAAVHPASKAACEFAEAYAVSQLASAREELEQVVEKMTAFIHTRVAENTALREALTNCLEIIRVNSDVNDLGPGQIAQVADARAALAPAQPAPKEKASG